MTEIAPPPSGELLVLQQLLAGRYSIERELGRGGMGIVFLARDVALDRLVAIKLLPPQLANPAARDRFLREARTAAGLSHPNIVPIHAVEQLGDCVFFVMGYVDGETLRERVARTGPLAPRLAMQLMQEAGWALAHAHRGGRLPLEESNVPAIITKQVTEPAPRLEALRPEVPRRLADLVDRCLAKEPAKRIQTGHEAARVAGGVRGKDLRRPPRAARRAWSAGPGPRGGVQGWAAGGVGGGPGLPPGPPTAAAFRSAARATSS